MVKGGSCIFFLCLYLLFFGMVEWAFERAVPPPVITVRWRDVFPELDPVMRELSLCASEIRDRFPLLAASDIYTCDHAARHGAPPAGPFTPACAAEASGHLRAITEPTDLQMQHYKKRDEERKSQPKPQTLTPKLRPKPHALNCVPAEMLVCGGSYLDATKHRIYTRTFHQPVKVAIANLSHRVNPGEYS